MTTTINGRTPDEIKKGLECCIANNGRAVCGKCPYSRDGGPYLGCMYINSKDTLAYIQQLERERDAAVERCIVADEDYADLYWETKRMETAAPKWISVKERLPRAFYSVLVYIPEEAPMPTVHEGYMTDNGRWISTVYVREFEKVTHWMPLPEPPKED